MTEHLLDTMCNDPRYANLTGTFDVLAEYPAFDSIAAAVMKRAQIIGHADFARTETRTETQTDVTKEDCPEPKARPTEDDAIQTQENDEHQRCRNKPAF